MRRVVYRTAILLTSVTVPFLPYKSLIYQLDDTDRNVGEVSFAAVEVSHLNELALQYREQGFALLRGVVPSALAARLRAEAQAIFRQRREEDRLPLVPVNALYSSWLESAVLRGFWGSSNIAAVVGRVTGTSMLRLLDDLVIVTEPTRMAFGCWHSDWYSYGSVTRATHHAAFSVWIPLVNISAQTRGGSLQFCGRESVPANCTQVDFDSEAKEGQRGIAGLGDSWCEQLMEKACLTPDFQAGDAVIFAADMIHRTQELRDPDFRRFSLIGRFVGPEARYRQRRTPFLNHHTYKVRHDMCEHGLRENDPMRGVCFPQLLPTANRDELHGERRFVNHWFATMMAHLEWAWFGENMPD